MPQSRALKLSKAQCRANKALTRSVKISVKMIEYWLEDALKKAEADPTLSSIEESITLMCKVEQHESFKALIQKLKDEGFKVRYQFGTTTKDRPILNIILEWAHLNEEAEKSLKDFPTAEKIEEEILKS
ncbi:MAG: hypothetical protein VXY83_04860 [Pseudomonadota bacterium]|nr:hypothetical protein [Magnetococcales bacterium]MEC8467672.1 hypothetical protein [Pseudomonadota bacterium]|tara:strand:+ start:25560 stop:25946 length:387 start_codon:yes stop_codon:yes gene_type:complete